MRNIILTTISLILSNFFNNICAQNHRFYYDFTYKIDSTGISANDLLVLQVQTEGNIFLSYDFIRTDSLNAVKKYEIQYINPQYNSIITYSKDKNTFTAYKKVDMNYFKFDFQKKIKWKILLEKKTISNIKVQKAITNYGGRNWIAWFSNDIPLTYGPYVFYGLPGLIIEIQDEQNNFHYTLIKSQKINNNIQFKLNNVFDQKVIDIKYKDWKTIQLNYFNNPLYNYKTIGWTMFNKSGEKFSQQDYREMEIRIRKELIRYNNPIELDEKVFYK